MMHMHSKSVLAAAVLALFAAGCNHPKAESAPPPAAQPTYLPTATIKDLMQSVVDVNADVVWLAVTAESTAKGLIEHKPKTDEDWTKVRHGAVSLSEAANLLMIPGRRVARPGEKSETPGVELEPDEMQALIEMDRKAWNGRATALHDAVTKTIAAIDEKDADKVFELGAEIERACENCHTHYWYPNEVIPNSVPDTAAVVGESSNAKPARK